MNLADKVRGMAEMVDEESIAHALSLPLEVVKKVLNNEIDDAELDKYDSSRSIDVRVIKEKTFVHSLSVGVISFGCAGGTTLTAAMASLTAHKHQTLAIDFNEIANLGFAIGVKPDPLLPNLAGWIFNNSSGSVYTVPQNENLQVLLGTPDLPQYLKFKPERFGQIVGSFRNTCEFVWVDMPRSINLWPSLFPQLDYTVFVLEPDNQSIMALYRCQPVIDLDNAGIVLVDPDSNKDNIKALRKIIGLPILGSIPHVKDMQEKNRNYVLENPKSKYTQAVSQILNNRFMENKIKIAPKSFLDRLLTQGG